MEIKKWLGLKNTSAPEHLEPGELEVAQNVDIDNAGKLSSRLGYTLVQSGSYHSLWASDKTCYVMIGQDLRRLMPDGTIVQLKRLTSGQRVAYAEYNGVVYYSNGVDKGRIVGGEPREWGVKAPALPTAARYVGSLPAGRYLYSMTFVRSDGFESGAKASGMFELTQMGGILFSGLEVSTNPEVSGKILYLSTANGSTLYRVAVLPPIAAAHAYMNDGLDLSAPLTRQFVEQPPAGNALEIHNGVGCVIAGNVVYLSDAYSIESFRLAESRFLQLPGRITLFGSVGTGIYVGTERGTWFLKGNNTNEMTSVQVLSYGAIEGTSVKFDEEEETVEERKTESHVALMWTTPFGIVVGNSEGAVRNVTEDKYGFPGAQRGAGALKFSRGFTQYLSTLQGSGATPNIYE